MKTAYDPATFWGTIAKRIDREYTRKFLFAGNCRFTLLNSLNQHRITYRLRRPKSIRFHAFQERMRYDYRAPRLPDGNYARVTYGSPWCALCAKHKEHPFHWLDETGVSLFRLELKINLDPTDNKGWEMCGYLVQGPDGLYQYKHWSRSKVLPARVEINTFEWFLRKLQSNSLPDALWVYHMGSCARCGKDLDVPTSIEAGFGPDCLEILNGPSQ